jgi:8-hydroxy-5-deazaflavin:NADPH oxidoreductase
MKIGVIGAGHIGQALARAALRNGHDVMMANSRGPQTLAALAQELQCAAGTVAQAAAFGEVVILAIPLHAVAQLDPGLFAGRIVLDANNYYPARDGAIAALDTHQATTSGLVQQRLGSGARVVKFFNAIMAPDIPADARPRGTPGRRALPIAGDDAEARRIAADLVDQFGYDPVDAGSLADSWRFERAMPAYCVPFDVAGLQAALASAQRGVELPHGSWRRKRPA